jgi:hypothetical protein
MNAKNEQLEAITEMRDLMNRSSRFLSLSGISGVCAGLFALAGAAVAYLYYAGWLFRNFPFAEVELQSREGYMPASEGHPGFYEFFLLDAGSVLLLSLFFGWFFSQRKAKKSGIPFWDHSAWRTLANLMLPLIAGGIFCLAMLYHGAVGLIAPATLIFYGLGLLNASKYTVNDIRYLGLCQVALGLIGTIFVGYGLLFWTIGFGVLHIIYGAVMYFKYER